MTAEVRTWVVGAGGLIGSAVARADGVLSFPAARIPWGSTDAVEVLNAELDRFVAWVGEERWGIVWAAGAGVMRTSRASLDDELEVFRAFCLAASRALPSRHGGMYLVSSAGGVFAGSQSPPFDAATSPHPLNDYGRTKLEQERIASDVLASRLPVTMGRMANVYGPGQDLSKGQGLVTELSLCSLLNRPATIFAPLSTLRDYIYVDDAARLVVAELHRMTQSDAGSTLRVVCSGRTTSIAELISLVQAASGQTIPLIHALSDGPFILDLRLVGSPEGVPFGAQPTSLETGIAWVFRDLQQRLANGSLVGLV